MTNIKNYDIFLLEYLLFRIFWKGYGFYIMEESVKYVCKVCGYVYEGDIDSEPDDYVCPVCGVGKDMFDLQ